MDDISDNVSRIFGEHPDGPAHGRDQELLAAVHRIGIELGFTARLPAAPGADGVTAQAIADASGARCRRIRLPAGWWRHDYGTLLAWLGDARAPVALLPRAMGGYTLHEPALDRSRPLTAELAAQLAPDAECFYATLPDAKLTLFQVLGFGIGRGWRDWLLLGMAGAGSAVLAMALPYAISVLFSDVVPDGNRHQLRQIGLALLITTLAVFVLDCVSGLAHARMVGRNAANLTAALWDRMLRLPPSTVQRAGAGDIAMRMSTGAMLQESVIKIGFDLCTRGQHLLVSLAALFIVAPMLGLLAFFMASVLALATWVMNLVQTQAVTQGAPVQGNVFNQPIEYLNAVGKLRTAGAEGRAFTRWAANFTELRRRSFKAGRVSIAFHAFCSAYEVLALAAMFYFIARPGGLLTSHGLGLCMVLISAFGTFMGSLLPVAQGLSGVGMLLARGRRLALLMESVPVGGRAGVDPGKLSGQLVVDGVSARYNHTDQLALQRVSVRAEAGEFIAIVGPSGGGKSTLVRVMLGLLKPEQGSVLYDGRDLATLKPDAVRRQIGTVMQHGRLIPGTLRDNIAGPHDVGLEDIWLAAHCAAIDADIQAMPMQMHTMVLDGAAAFSGGQMQRMLIARSLVSKPPIAIFDEATSALDARTQALVVERVGALRCTRIVIAHRFSTIRNADRVYVMEGGKITEEGSVEALLASGGYLAHMAQREGVQRPPEAAATTSAPTARTGQPAPALA